MFDKPYATTIGKMYTGTTLIPYTKVTSIRYQAPSKKDPVWKIDVNSLSVILLQGLLLLFLETLPTKMKNFITQASRKF